MQDGMTMGNPQEDIFVSRIIRAWSPLEILELESLIKLFASGGGSRHVSWIFLAFLVYFYSFGSKRGSFRIVLPDEFLVKGGKMNIMKRLCLLFFALALQASCYKSTQIRDISRDYQSHTLPSDIYPILSTPGRSYSVEELKELEAISQLRGITIIPEMDRGGVRCTRLTDIFKRKYL